MAEDKQSISFRQRFKNTTTKLNNSKSFNGMMGMANSVLSAIPSNSQPKNENDAIGSSIRGAAADALMSGVAGPWGMAAGAAIKIMDKTGGFSSASKGLGGKNDTLNTIASFAIPGAGWFAKKTDKFKVSDYLASSSGFTGTAKNAKTVQGNANAKILFGRGKANRQIAQMKETQGTIGNILNNNKDLMASQASNAQDIADSFDFNKMGGWGANTMQFGRSGLKLKDKEQIKRISRKRRLEEVASFQKGGKAKSDDQLFEEFRLSLPENLKNTDPDKYDLRRYWELNDKPDKFYADSDMYHLDEIDGYYHIPSVAWNGEGFEFMKRPHHSTVTYELQYYNSEDAADFRKQWKLARTPRGFIYRKRKPEEMRELEIDGGRVSFPGYELKGFDGSRDNYVEQFKTGGKIGHQSVIPGGALHARKHKLGEYDENLAGQVTHKGVPVVSFEFGGEIEQHAEIERGEIIFRKEITDMIEALKKDGSDEAAIQAGKIIAEEIINNTIDNSGEYEIENKEQDIHGKKGNK